MLIQKGFFDDKALINKERKIKKIVNEPASPEHINDIIKLKMPFFKDYLLDYHIERVREVMKLNLVPDKVVVEVLDELIQIPHDIETCFRRMTSEESEQIAYKYAEALLPRQSGGYKLMDEKY